MQLRHELLILVSVVLHFVLIPSAQVAYKCNIADCDFQSFKDNRQIRQLTVCTDEKYSSIIDKMFAIFLK